MSPDYEYFLRLSATGHLGHTFAGLFLFDLPLSLLVFWVFHRYTRRALAAAAPGAFPVVAGSPPGSALGGAASVTVVILSVLLGAFTHIIWDSLTHPTFWPYRHIPLLSTKVNLSPVGIFECYQFFQGGSSLFGIAVLLFLWAGWLRSRAERGPVGLRPAGVWLLAAATVFAALRVLVGNRLHPLRTVEVGIAEAVVTFMAVLWLGLLVYGILLRQAAAPAHTVR